MATVKSQIDRCMQVIELLGTEGLALPLGEIARRIDLPKSATHRLLAQLSDGGWVVQDTATGFYGLSLKLTLVGQRFLHQTGLPDLYQPCLERLAAETEAFVRIAVVEGDGLTWIGQAQGGRTGLIYQPELLAIVPLRCTANGKAWLASLPFEEAFRLILTQEEAGPIRRGPCAKESLDEVREQLELTRARGWALAEEEAEAGVAAIAAPIYGPAADGGDVTARVVGTLSVAGPVVRITPDKYERIAAAIQAAAEELSALWPIRPSQLPPRRFWPGSGRPLWQKASD